MDLDNEKLFNLADRQTTPSSGSVLVAKPTVDDPVFGRSVVLLIEHGDEGSAGFILNKHMGDILWNDTHQVPFYLGGPVGGNAMTCVHTLGQEIADSRPLGGGLFLGGDMADVSQVIATGRMDGALKWVMGYSGWAEGQLLQEIEQHDWAVLNDVPPQQLLASGEPQAMWQAMIERLGERYRLWLNWPANLWLN